MENSNDTTENRTRDLPACSAPPHAPNFGEVQLLELPKDDTDVSKHVGVI